MTLFEHENECVCSYTIFIVLAVIALTISIGIGVSFAYKYMNHVKKTDKKNISLLKLEMGQVKGININNRRYYFFNDTINIEVFDSN